MALLKGFTFPSAHGDLGPISGGTSLFMDYFSDRLQDEMAEWDIAFPIPRGGDPSAEVIVPGHAVSRSGKRIRVTWSRAACGSLAAGIASPTPMTRRSR